MTKLSISISLGAPGSGGGAAIIKTATIMRDARVMRDNIRMTDNG